VSYRGTKLKCAAVRFSIQRMDCPRQLKRKNRSTGIGIWNLFKQIFFKTNIMVSVDTQAVEAVGIAETVEYLEFD
jgi:hypothetical protein